MYECLSSVVNYFPNNLKGAEVRLALNRWRHRLAFGHFGIRETAMERVSTRVLSRRRRASNDLDTLGLTGKVASKKYELKKMNFCFQLDFVRTKQPMN
jgi:hypothetical protein